MTFQSLQRLVANDAKTRYTMVQEPDPGSLDNDVPVWWIRANQGHSMKVRVAIRVVDMFFGLW